MKITKAYLKKLIKEEIKALADGDKVDTWGENNFLEIIIDGTGREKTIEKVEVTDQEEVKKEDYKYTRGSYDKFKALVKIVKVAELEKPSEDY